MALAIYDAEQAVDARKVAEDLLGATRQERIYIKRHANSLEQNNAGSLCWACQQCLWVNFSHIRHCAAPPCDGFNHHVRSQQQYERSFDKLKFNLINGLPIAAHFARMIGLECDHAADASYGDEGAALAHTLDPQSLPGAESYPELVLNPTVFFKGSFANKNKLKGRPTPDAKYNSHAKNARTEYRKRMNDETLTCVHRWHNDLGGTKLNPWDLGEKP